MAKTTISSIFKFIKDPNEYIKTKYPDNLRSTHFEKLTAESFSHILAIPFYDKDDDFSIVPHKVVWQGKLKPLTKADKGCSDIIAYCHDFNLLIEATQKEGANQWKTEFASAHRHCDEFISQNQSSTKEIFILLVTPSLFIDTYRSIKSNPHNDHKFIPLETSSIKEILKTLILVNTIQHFEIQRLFNKIQNCIKDSLTIDDYKNKIHRLLLDWKQRILKAEKFSIIGLQSYKAMIMGKRKNFCIADISPNLYKNKKLNQYFKILGDKLSPDMIIESLIQQKLGYLIEQTHEGEEIFAPIPIKDFIHRNSRFVEAVEVIYGKST